jgi:hypothetical protein
MAKLVALLSTACLMCLLLGIIIFQHFSLPGVVRETLDARAVVKEVRQLNELVTVRYSIQKVIGMKEDRPPLGTESILLLVQGKVLAGIDLAGLTPNNVTMRGRGKELVAVIRLPPPHLAEAFLDERYTKVWDRRITWWTPWISPDVDLEHKARLQALEEIKQAALDMGILAEAQRNAETSIRTLLQAFGIPKSVFDYSS